MIHLTPQWRLNWSMSSEALVLHPPNANLGLTSVSPFLHRNQLRGPRQAPPLEVAELQQLGIVVDEERALDSAS